MTLYEVKLIMQRRSYPEVFLKKVFLEILQNSQENNCAQIFFDEIASLHLVALFKKILRHRCF